MPNKPKPPKNSPEMRLVPRRALIFAEPAVSQPMESSDGKTFTIRLYSGQPVEHWLFGRVAIDISGVKSKFPMAVLQEHSTSQKVGIAESGTFTGGISLTGRFLNTECAAEIQKLKADGFPYQASARYGNVKRIERIAEGSAVEVNGYTVSGPAEVWRECSLLEGSICTLGADADTGLAASTSDPEVWIPVSSPPTTAKEIEMGDTVAADIEAAEKKGQEAERARFAALAAAFPDQPGFVSAQFAAGASVEQAKGAFADVLAAELKAAKTSAEQMTRDLQEKQRQLDEAKRAVPFSASDAGKTPPPAEPTDPESVAKREWAASPELHAEFLNDEARYIAYRTHELAGHITRVAK